MKSRQVVQDVWSVGAIDWERRWFDELIPLPDGTSYNAYLIKGRNKIALIDTVDPTFTQVLFRNLEELGITQIDYLISNHAEQDHSGSIPYVLERYPHAKLLISEKAKPILSNLLHIPQDRIEVVQDSQSIDLGGLSLQFIYFPWVHWPETMLTWLPEKRILFTCDLFGSHLASSSLFVEDKLTTYLAAKRYYAQIMMPFANIIRQNFQKILDLNPQIIAPSHGPIYNEPQFIIEAYHEWIDPRPKKLVLLLYVSMHGSTRIMVDYFINQALSRNLPVEKINLLEADLGKIAMLMVDASTIVLATPMVLGGAHPLMATAAYVASILKPKAKFIGIIGSYSWGGKLLQQLKDILSPLKAEFLEPVIAKGLPSPSDYQAIDALVEQIYEKNSYLS